MMDENENENEMMMGGYNSSSPISECLGDDHFIPNKIRRSKKKNSKKIRFSDQQIRCLEVMFESDTKLEARKKVEIAKELGLQPRQVAIWFQNKRARWKSKQIEKDYSLLLADYNNLASQFENLKKDNQSLLTQLQKLKNEIAVKPPENENQCRIHYTPGNSDGDDDLSDYKKIEFDDINVMNKSFDGNNILSDDDNNNNNNSSTIKTTDQFLGFDEEENQHHQLQLHIGADTTSLTSAEEWGSLDSDDLIHNHSSDHSCQWWDFWS